MTTPKRFASLDLAATMAVTDIAVVLPGQPRSSISLSWDYDTNNLPDVFKLYTSTNLSLPTTNWTVLGASLNGTGIPLSATNLISASEQRFFRIKVSP